MADLNLANVIEISVSQAQMGLNDYNVNNLALFTTDRPGSSFGILGYQIYLDPTVVATDFGSDSETFALANQVFSQQPNILAGGGYLVVMPLLPAEETLSSSAPAVSGSVEVLYGSNSFIVNYNDSPSAIQAAVQAIPGLEQVGVEGSALSVGGSNVLTFSFYGFYGSPAAFTVGSNTLLDGGSGSIAISFAVTGSGETLGAAITRTSGLVQYFGIMPDLTADDLGSADCVAAAQVVQPLNKLLFLASENSADIQPSGLFDNIRSASEHKTRCLYYGGTAAEALNFMAGYAGRALSTNFNGTNTTETMHLKDISGVTADPTMTQTLLIAALNAGADTYPSLQGVPKVFCSGENMFFDQVYNLGWFVGALQVAGFNYLAESSTKIPQTEQGMTGLKGAYRAVCQQAVGNQYLAPGSWTSSTTFGNQVDFLSNISNYGYYIFSQPISQQAQSQRAARVAPLIQIAVKESGAIQKSDVIVYVNA